MMEEALNTVIDTATDQDKIKDEIFSYFKVILNTEPNFIRSAKTIVCYEIHLPFSLGLSEGYNFKIINREQFFVYSELPRHEHMVSVMKCYGFSRKKWDQVTKMDKSLVIEKSLITINDIIKIVKSKFGNTKQFLLNSANRDYSDMVFTYSVDLRTVSHGGALLNIDSIYHPTQAESKPLFTSNQDYDYLQIKLEEENFDRIIDAFYYQCLAKENELDKNFNAAVINMQTGIEILMYAIFNKFIDKGVLSRPNGRIAYKNLLSHHLKSVLETDDYKFDILNEESDLYQYWNQLYLIRNNIVHDGYSVNYTEFIDLVRPSCDDLIKGLGKILNQKYPELNIKIEYSN